MELNNVSPELRGVKSNLIGVVEASASQAKIRSFISRMKPQSGMGGGQRLQVSMRKAPFNGFIRFIAQLSDQNINLGMLKLRPGNDSGLVDVDMALTGE